MTAIRAQNQSVSASRNVSVANETTLRQGSRGESVRQLQTQLQDMGAPIAADGIFGPKTKAAVRDFQSRQGLQVDGIVGPQTMSRLSGAGANQVVDRMEARPTGAGAPRAPRGVEPRASVGRLRRGLAAEQGAQTQRTTNNVQAQPGQPANQTAVFDRVVRNAGQRNQMVQGRITVNGQTYSFLSGGGGKGNLPKGDYTIRRHKDYRNDRSMNVGGEGYSFEMSDKYDPRVGAKRTLLRIHPDGAGPGTIGCIGIVGDAATQRRFRADMLAELRRSGGSFTLSVR